MRLDETIVERYNVQLPLLPAKLTVWLFASIIQNADFYAHHHADAAENMEVPPRIERKDVNTMRSSQFRNPVSPPPDQPARTASFSPTSVTLAPAPSVTRTVSDSHQATASPGPVRNPPTTAPPHIPSVVTAVTSSPNIGLDKKSAGIQISLNSTVSTESFFTHCVQCQFNNSPFYNRFGDRLP